MCGLKTVTLRDRRKAKTWGESRLLFQCWVSLTLLKSSHGTKRDTLKFHLYPPPIIFCSFLPCLLFSLSDMKAWQGAAPPTRSYEHTLTVWPEYERLNIWLPCPWPHSAGPPVQRSWSQPPWWSHQSQPQTCPHVPSSCSAGSAAPGAGRQTGGV